jgi:phosphatidate cytidylyltransferase
MRADRSRLVLRTRLKTAFIALPLLLVTIMLAPAPIFTVALLGSWGLFEIGEMTHKEESRWILVALAGGVPGAEMLISGHALPDGPMLCLMIFFLLMLLVAIVGREGANDSGPSALLGVLGAAWVGFFFPYFALLRNREKGIPLIVLALLLAFTSDTGAYFVGRWAGRIKLLPQVSPNKTVEGAIGGIGLALIAGVLLRSSLVPGLSTVTVVALSFAAAILAQAGDLANSAFKRVVGVKDSGWIFPGHGGLMDRASSLVFPTALIYYWLH